MTVSGAPLIDPRIDAYGTKGRTGALADLLEIRALKGRGMSVADLADLIYDMGWTTKPTRQLIMDDESENGAAEPIAAQTFSLLQERLDILGDRYPFEFEFGRLRIRPGLDPAKSAYIALLAISIAHAWRVPCDGDAPEAVLEILVAQALNRSMAAVGLGTGDRNGVSFVENLRVGAEAIGLAASPNPTPRKVRVKDAGVDTLAGLVWSDRRPGHWVFIGQVTCSVPDRWEAKMAEPKPAIWKNYLQEPQDPRRFLAVPHHVDPQFFRYLHLQGEGLILDRLRLALTLDAVAPAANPVVSAVLDADT